MRLAPVVHEVPSMNAIHDHGPSWTTFIDRRLSRRQFLTRSTLLAAGLVTLPGLDGQGFAAVPPTYRPLTGYRDYAMAMHIHSSFSEGKGSMQAQLAEASANAVDVVWWTEHDWRMNAHGYRSVVHFDSLTQESEAGRPWLWQPQTTGSPAAIAGGIVSSPVSANDPSASGALHVLCAAGSATLPSSYRYYANASQARVNQRANITGQTLTVDVFPQTVGPDAWLEVLVSLSQRPALSGRPAGQYQLSYRLGTNPSARRRDSSTPLLGIVDMPVLAGAYQTVTLDLTADVAALWPDLAAPGDNVLYDLWLGATARCASTAEGFFDHLVFSRSQAAGQGALAVQAGLVTAYAPLFPHLAQIAAQEASYFDQHMNVYGGRLGLQNYDAYPNVWSNSANLPFATYLSGLVHASGGMSSLNHPFGPGASPVKPGTDQTILRHTLLAKLLATNVCDVDIIELGYRQRGGATLETHLALGDCLWRNGFLLTATGVSDDHTAGVKQWLKNPNRFITSAWADSAGEADLIKALRAGRIYSGEIGSGAKTIDSMVDGLVPMGSVSVRPDLTTRDLKVQAAGLPVGSYVEVVQGPVDYPGTVDLEPRSCVIATLPAAAFALGGAVSVSVDTSASTFVRTAVVNASGRRVSFGNPTWLMHEQPRKAVPVERIAPDSR